MMSNSNSYKPRYVSSLPRDYELSPELHAQAEALAEHLILEYEDRKRQMYDLLKRYPQDESLAQYWTPERIEEYASGADNTDAVERLRSNPVYNASYHDIQSATIQDAKQTCVIFTAMGEAVKNHIEAGLLASDALGFKMPYERLEFSIIRKGFIDEWQPRGGVEGALVDMLTQTFIAWQFWLKRSFDVAQNQDWAEQQIAQTKSYGEHGTWNPPRVTAKEWLDHSTQMADRFNRMFLRILRQMRDLRRYSQPVIVQNAEQVNIAGEGAQQTNVQRKAKKKKTTPARTPLRIAGKR